jgi:UDP-galactopyranose mutase
MTTVDYLIVGSGLTGATIARRLHDHNREVLVLERRNHLGGNVHDFNHPSNIRVHTYGPHYFRCRSQEVWDFVQRFSTFYRYEAIVRSRVNGSYKVWPPNQAMLEGFPDWHPDESHTAPDNFESACLRKMPRPLYDTFVRGYTRRQWGMDPRLLSPKLAERVRINPDHQTAFTPHYPVQALPAQGYAQMMKNMTAALPTVLGIDYLEQRSEYQARKALIFTGSLDDFFGCDSGRLEYRGQRRRHLFLPNTDYHQPCVQVNHPDADDEQPIRTIEWKHLMPADQQPDIKGTLITAEYPFTPTNSNEFEYPVPCERSRALYAHYRQRAAALPKLVPCGRLGAYRYLDMDTAIARALRTSQALLGNQHDASAQAAGALAAV